MFRVQITHRPHHGRPQTDTLDLTQFSRFEDLRAAVDHAVGDRPYTLDHQIMNPPHPHSQQFSLVEIWGMYQISKRASYARYVADTAAEAIARAAEGAEADDHTRARAAALMSDLYGVLADYDVPMGPGAVAEALAAACLVALTCDEETRLPDEDEPRILYRA